MSLRDGINWRAAAAEKAIRRVFGLPDIQWMRVVMQRAVREFVASLPVSNLSCMEVSGKHWQATRWGSYLSLEYPAFDICRDRDAGPFDVIICEQVLEHVQSPRKAIENAHAMLSPGGWLIVDTPFLVKIHNHPIDCTRWTEAGLRLFLIECGFRDIQTGSWGNRACVKANFRRWMPYYPWHSLRNEPDFPMVVWGFARKP